MTIHTQGITCRLQGHMEVIQGSGDVLAGAHSFQETIQRFGGGFQCFADLRRIPANVCNRVRELIVWPVSHLPSQESLGPLAWRLQ